MTLYTIEADGEILIQTENHALAESLFEAAQLDYESVTMHEEHVGRVLH